MLFGHHRPGPTLGSQIAGFLHGVPIPIWVAAIGLVAAVATPIVQHVIARSRERSVARDDLRRAAETREQTVVRVRADLLFRLRAHLVLLRALAAADRVDMERWHHAFERFAERTHEADAIETLGAAYHAFVQPVHAERVALEVERSVALGARPPGTSSERIAALANAYLSAFALLGALAGDPEALPAGR